MKGLAMGIRGWLSLSLGLLWLGPAAVAQGATGFTYQGELKQAGQPAQGSFDLGFCLYASDDPSVLVPLSCAPIQEDVPVSAGRFTVTIDFGAVFALEDRFLEVRVREGLPNGAFTPLSPRQALTPTPQAQHAQRAPWLGLSGVPAGFADGSDDVGSGTVTGVSAGFGLSGGPISTSGTLAVDPLVMQRRVLGNCAAGRYLRAVGEDGSVTCGDDANAGGTVTSVGSGAGLQGGPIIDSGSLAVDFSAVQARIAIGCATGQALRAVNADGSVICEPLPASPVRLNVIEDNANEFGYAIAARQRSASTPAIAHWDFTAGTVRFVRCNDPYCQGGNEVVNVVDSGNVGGDIALAFDVNGRPVLAYLDTDDGAIKLARCSDAACAPGNVTINAVAGSGQPSANAAGLAMVLTAGDRPLMAYRDFTTSAPMVLRCNDALCAGGDETITALSTFVSTGVSIALGSDALPVIAYCERDTSDGSSALWFSKCNDAACAGNNETTTLLDDRASSACDSAIVAVPSDGLPVIAYEGGSALGVRVVKCNDAACTGGDESRLVVDGPETAYSGSTDMILGTDGHPLITSRGAEGIGSLRFVHCGNAACSAGNQISVLDPIGSPKGPPAILLGRNGFPMVVYSNFAAHALMLAKCENNTCQ